MIINLYYKDPEADEEYRNIIKKLYPNLKPYLPGSVHEKAQKILDVRI